MKKKQINFRTDGITKFKTRIRSFIFQDKLTGLVRVLVEIPLDGHPGKTMYLGREINLRNDAQGEL